MHSRKALYEKYISAMCITTNRTRCNLPDKTPRESRKAEREVLAPGVIYSAKIRRKKNLITNFEEENRKDLSYRQ